MKFPKQALLKKITNYKLAEFILTVRLPPIQIYFFIYYLVSGEKGDSKKDESFKCPTSDGKSVTVELEFSYRFDEERVANTFVTFKGKNGETIKDTFIKPKVSAWTQEITALYPVTDIFGDKRTDINAHLDEYLKSNELYQGKYN